MNKLPNDIIITIIHETKIKKQDFVWKKRHNLMIKHLGEYLEGLGTDEPDPEYISDGIMRYDCRFLEYNDAWETSLGDIILDKWGEDDIDEFMDNDF